ncbi:B-cell antigen receptor complex-associated protein beta chain isoform X2 [Pyxicephalus adspersus]|uniref:B-cell antigen receptor complex-associated protein beta chain isoform X2 n=1 Tax=Pyxicephalus adspersus TaxID=30357 RepID=UPI003B5B9A2C
MMNTPEAVLSVVFIAIFIIEHGDSIAGTGNPGRPTTVQHKEPSKSPYGKFIHHQYEDTMQAVLPDPRFVGVRKGRNITIQCGCRSFLPVSNNITWFKEHTNGSFVTYVLKDEHISMAEDVLFIKNVQKKHNGVYICNFTTNGQKLFPCGTEVMVLGAVCCLLKQKITTTTKILQTSISVPLATSERTLGDLLFCEPRYSKVKKYHERCNHNGSDNSYCGFHKCASTNCNGNEEKAYSED